MEYKLGIYFESKQSDLEAEGCGHGFHADTIQIRGNKMFIGEREYMREIDLSKDIKKFKIKIVEEED